MCIVFRACCSAHPSRVRCVVADSHDCDSAIAHRWGAVQATSVGINARLQRRLCRRAERLRPPEPVSSTREVRLCTPEGVVRVLAILVAFPLLQCGRDGEYDLFAVLIIGNSSVDDPGPGRRKANAPDYEGATPRNRGATPRYEGTTHHYEGMTHHYEGTTHHYEGTTHRYEGRTHRYEGTTHHYEGTPHHYEGTTHRYEGISAADEGRSHLGQEIPTGFRRSFAISRKDQDPMSMFNRI